MNLFKMLQNNVTIYQCCKKVFIVFFLVKLINILIPKYVIHKLINLSLKGARFFPHDFIILCLCQRWTFKIIKSKKTQTGLHCE